MARWKHELDIRDLYVDSALCSDAEAEERARILARRIRGQRFYFGHAGQLEAIALSFEMVESIEAFNACMDRLYDWADEDHKCWVRAF